MLPLLRKCRVVAVALEAARKNVAALGNYWAVKVSLVHATSVKLLRDQNGYAASLDFGLMNQILLQREALQICRDSVRLDRLGGASATDSALRVISSDASRHRSGPKLRSA
jgi:hypothetical protein